MSKIKDYISDVLSVWTKDTSYLDDYSGSKEWTAWRPKKTRAEDIALDLLRVERTVANLVRYHGVPKTTKVRVARLGDGVVGLASKEVNNNLILLSRSLYDDCLESEVIDVYCGVGLHEASHILHTKKMDARLKSGLLFGVRAVFEGLFEDTRIEEKVKEDSPGYYEYVALTKRILFEKKDGPYRKQIKGFNNLPDLDKVSFVIMVFIRTPHMLTPEMMEFKTLRGSNPYKACLEMFPRFPETEDVIKQYGRKLIDYFDSIKKEYDEDCTKTPLKIEKELKELGKSESSSEGSGSGGSGSEESLEKDDEDSSEEDSKEDSEEVKITDERKKDIQEILDKHLKARREDEVMKDALRDLDRSVRPTEDETDLSKIKRDGLSVESKLEVLDKKYKSREDRFNPEIDTDRITKAAITPVKIAEQLKIEEFTKDKLKELDDWSLKTWGTALGRKNIIIHPRPNDVAIANYERHKKQVAQHISKMRSIFRLRKGTTVYKDTQLKHGKLHRRMLGRSEATDRLFYEEYEKVSQGIAVCLVLDESGSMDSTRSLTSKAARSLQVAILIMNALRDQPGIESECYSFSSSGWREEDNYIKYLYGKSNPNLESLGNYNEGAENYDHIAIETCGKLFIDNTSNSNRLMIIVSDGAPAGYMYGGPEAEAATKKVVEMLERKHNIFVLHVEIEAYHAEHMFKHRIQFTNHATLVTDMKKLMTKIIRKLEEKSE